MCEVSRGHHTQERSDLGQPLPVNGVALTQARRDKEAKYAELVRNERCRLVVVALEVEGGAQRPWSSWQTWPPLGQGTHHRCCDAQRSVPCARAFATSLVMGQCNVWAGVDGLAPDLADLYREG